MKRILPIRGFRLRRRQAVWLGLAMWTACGLVSASTDREPPDGLPSGPVFFAPWFESEFLFDDNVFRRNEGQDPEPAADVVTTVRGGVTAFIPIRMSDLHIGYQGSTFFYRDADFEETDAHIGSVLFNLNFSNHNTLILEERYTRGVTELLTQESEGVELVGQGIPYDRNQFAVEWIRDVADRPSWRARAERVDHRYNSDLPVNWLDYEGWTVGYEYAQPIYRRGALVGSYDARREEHFEAGRSSALTPPVPLRRERYDGVEIGYRGIIGRNQPLLISLGYGRLDFRNVQGGDEPSEYRGLVGDLLWRLPVGGVSNMEVAASRRPFSSRSTSFSTYFISSQLRVGFDRRFREVSRYGARVLASRYDYGDLLPTSICGDAIRKDRRQQVQGFWEWFIQPRIALRLTAAHNRRNSNCDSANYRSNGLGMTFKVGWF